MNLESPRLAALAQAGDQTAADQFWQEITSTPLVEPIPGDDQFCWVTLLWRSDEPLSNVMVQSPLNDGDQSRNQMSHLPGTDVWFITYRLHRDTRTTYRLVPNDPLIDWSTFDYRTAEARATWEEYLRSAQLDPLNPRRYVFPKDDENPDDHEIVMSLLELPDAPPPTWIETGLPAGQVTRYDYTSAQLENTRRVWVYTPPGYASERGPYPLLVVLDGWAYIHLIPTPTILDNLIAEGRIQPVIALLVDNPDMDTRIRELSCSALFVDFLADDLLPWIAKSYPVTADPAQTTIAGSSLGGLTAAFAGLRRSDRFRNLLIQSGSFWWSPDDDTESEWMARQYVEAPRLPLRFYQDVGRLETIPMKSGRPTQVIAARHFRNTLRAKGYPLTYAEFSGGHDYCCWQDTLADGLMALL